ncbi:MAG: HlyC/CorC family transporter [Chloroflexaceae bacterium]|nr:HlyC/CorC family transporter [Chloroflexaceae bacterium]
MLGELSSEIIIILILILANGFFAGSEIAIVSSRQSRLEAMANEGNNAATQALKLAQHPDRFLATVQIGITFIGTFSAAFGGARIGDSLAVWFQDIPAIAPYAEVLALSIVVIAITYLSLVVGELVPKRLALQNAEQLAVVAAPVMTTLAFVARPLVALLTVSVGLLMRVLGKDNANGRNITQEDIVYLIREGTESGSVEAGEAQFIQRIFQFTDRPLYTMMTPRTEMETVRVDTPLPDIINTFLSSGYSRLPVLGEAQDEVLGVLHIRDIFKPIVDGIPQTDIRQLLRPAIFVVESAHGDDVLPQLRQQGAHMALVVGEYGQVTGLVTLEDLLEELVGDIRDEYDTDEDRAYVQREDGSWLIDALEPYDRVCQVLGVPLSKDEDFNFSSLASLIIDALERIPAVGDIVVIEAMRLEVVDMDERRIDKVLVSKVDTV